MIMTGNKAVYTFFGRLCAVCSTNHFTKRIIMIILNVTTFNMMSDFRRKTGHRKVICLITQEGLCTEVSSQTIVFE